MQVEMTTNHTFNTIAVESKCISHLAWISTGHLDGKAVGSVVVTFKHGGTYTYHWVPLHLYAAWHRSTSKGGFYHRHIRGRFAVTKPPKPRRQAKTYRSISQRRADRVAEVFFNRRPVAA